MKLQNIKTKILRIITQNFTWIIAIFMLVICFIIMHSLYENDIYIFDDYIYKYVSLIISPNMTVFLKLITEIGSSIVVLIICISSFVFMKNKIYSKLMTLNLILITGLNWIIKNIFNRERPIGFALIDETGYSFPSGHSMVSMAFYGFIIYLVFRFVKSKHIKITLISILSLLILLIGISRIYLGVHYASDVVEGFCISVVYLILVINILSKNKILLKE
ncbi:MAG: phosphatase PAP2 family protein [Clostridia bacterium]|nr:phosphatase PAP2 family protein [Clostridia bacterium]MDD4387047.1 phosphatase PAP2 family protein [Clostridia bacterium]